MARPKSVPDITLEDQVMKLAAINCTWSEIAAVIGLKEHTIRRRFAQIYKKGRESGKMSLKRKMYDLAINGNVTMCIWLSKQMLGYTDKVEQNQKVDMTEKQVIEVQWSDENNTQNALPNASTKKD